MPRAPIDKQLLYDVAAPVNSHQEFQDYFNDIALECDPSKIMSTLRARGDLELVGRSRPYYYHITLQGVRSYNAIMVKRANS